MEFVKATGLRNFAKIAAVCVFTSVIFIGIGIELPWAFLPAAGGALMLMGYNWGYSDRQSSENLDRRRSSRKRRFAAVSYSGSSERCGDSYGFTKLAEGKYAAVLSDGTGKGEIAAKESSRAVNAVLGLIRAGTDPELALQLLNLVLTMDNRKENFPTMDLALLDTCSRELYIYKIGAAPTVIRRTAGDCEVLDAPAIPMGVMENSRLPCVSTMVAPGDQIIMMTDGIIDSNCRDMELKWLQHLLQRIKSRNSQTVCDLIIREASLNYGSREKDDMTVMMFEVERK